MGWFTRATAVALGVFLPFLRLEKTFVCDMVITSVGQALGRTQSQHLEGSVFFWRGASSFFMG